ncbi:MAG: hypothetical protein ACXQTE_01335 [Methanosarcinaceae archaeon]
MTVRGLILNGPRGEVGAVAATANMDDWQERIGGHDSRSVMVDVEFMKQILERIDETDILVHVSREVDPIFVSGPDGKGIMLAPRVDQW